MKGPEEQDTNQFMYVGCANMPASLTNSPKRSVPVALKAGLSSPLAIVTLVYLPINKYFLGDFGPSVVTDNFLYLEHKELFESTFRRQN